jgi:hypothetical protein
MTVNDLIERLQEVAEEGMGDAEIRLAFQPSWPLQFTVGGIAIPDTDSDAPDEGPVDTTPVVYITEGSHPDDSPYAPGWVFETAR